MFVEKIEDCDSKQHGSRVHGTVIMHTRDKVCEYVAGRNYRSGKDFCYL